MATSGRSGRGAGRSRPRGGARPGRTRPAARRPAVAASRRRGAAAPPPQRRPRLTGRAAIVAVVLAVLLVSYASSLRAYLSQRDHINDLEARIAQDREAVRDLREERRRWRDEAFVEAQARERFGWVFPGEAGFRVIGEDGEPLDAASELTDPAAMGDDPDHQWWSTTWASIRGAGRERGAEPAPAQRLGPRPGDRERDRHRGR